MVLDFSRCFCWERSRLSWLGSPMGGGACSRSLHCCCLSRRSRFFLPILIFFPSYLPIDGSCQVWQLACVACAGSCACVGIPGGSQLSTKGELSLDAHHGDQRLRLANHHGHGPDHPIPDDRDASCAYPSASGL